MTESDYDLTNSSILRHSRRRLRHCRRHLRHCRRHLRHSRHLNVLPTPLRHCRRPLRHCRHLCVIADVTYVIADSIGNLYHGHAVNQDIFDDAVQRLTLIRRPTAFCELVFIFYGEALLLVKYHEVGSISYSDFSCIEFISLRCFF